MAEPKTTIAEGVKLAYEATDDIADIKEDYLSKSEGGTINASITIQGGALSVSSSFGSMTYGASSISRTTYAGSYTYDFPYASGRIGMWGDDPFSISLTMDEDYKLQASLRKNDGTILNSQVIDLPLESMIVGIEYDSETKSLIITLQNGETASIPVDDIIGDNVVFVDNVQWVRDNQMTVSIAVDATHNINGRELTNFVASQTAIGGYPAILVQYQDNTKLTEEQAARYMHAMTGSNYVPRYDSENMIPTNSYIMFADKTLWKPQYDDTNGLVLFSMNTTILDAESDQTITGTKTFSSNVVLANTSSGESPEIRLQNNVSTTRIRANGYSTDISTHWLPRNGNTYTLGNSQTKWKELYLSGAASIGSLSLVGNSTWGLIPNQYGGLNVTKAGTSMYSFSDLAFFPQSNGSRNLGASNLKWNNLFISGNLNDGTNSVTVANIATKQEVENVREVAEGKCESYVLSYSDTMATVMQVVSDASSIGKTSGVVCLLDGTDITSTINDYSSASVLNSIFNSSNDSVQIDPPDFANGYLIIRTFSNLYVQLASQYQFILVPLADFEPKTGDVFLVVETDVPDRWISENSNGSFVFYKMETTKVDLTNYVTTNTAQTITGEKTISDAKLKFENTSSTYGWAIDEDAYEELRFLYNNGTKFYICNGFAQTQGLRPTGNNTYDLGTSTKKWKDLYLSGNIDFNGIATIETLSDRVKAKYNGVDGWEWGTNSYRVFTPLATAAIYPTSDNQKDIGLSSQRYKDIYLGGKIDLNASNSTTITTNASGEIVVDRNGTTIFNFGNTNGTAACYYDFLPNTDGGANLGKSSKRWWNVYVKNYLTDGTNNVAVANIATKDQFVKLTQAQYDALTPDPDTFYFIEEE